MKQTRSITLAKTRLVRRRKIQTWLKAEITTEYRDQEPTMDDVYEMISDIDAILITEEESEYARWNESKN